MPVDVPSGFACRVCGEWHNGLPLSYSVKPPNAVLLVPKKELDDRVVITPDQCVIDHRDHYLRGRFAIPVQGLDEPFIWGVWARVSSQDFYRTNRDWTREGREQQPPFAGWLDTEIPVYGNTVNLRIQVQTMRVGRRPHFFVADEQHPLAKEVRDGITLDRVQQFAEMLRHSQG